MLSQTGTPNPNDTDHLGIAISTQYIEQQMIPALRNATVSWFIQLRLPGTLVSASVKLN